MAENIFTSFDISAQGMKVQRMRLSAVANNIANANTTKGPDGKPYQREIVVVQATQKSPFESELRNSLELSKSAGVNGEKTGLNAYSDEEDRLTARVAKDTAEPRLVYDPHHPDANTEGYVEIPNINIVTEMVEMMTAQRGFEANVQVTEAAKNIARYSFEI